MQASVPDRLIGASGAAIAVAGLLYMLLFGMSVDFHGRREQPVTLVDLTAPPPRPIIHRVEHRKTARAAAAPSPRNLRNTATEIVAPPPPPLPLPPPPPPVITAPKAGAGMAASAGASDRPGPGQGAGGFGDGAGGGGFGDGDGGEPPRQIRGRLKFSDLPPDLSAVGAGGSVEVRYDVGIDGRVTNCIAIGSSGRQELDRITCSLIEERFRFRPARDEDGRPVRSTIEESHSWIIERSRDPPEGG